MKEERWNASAVWDRHSRRICAWSRTTGAQSPSHSPAPTSHSSASLLVYFSTLPHHFKCSPLSPNHPDQTWSPLHSSLGNSSQLLHRAKRSHPGGNSVQLPAAKLRRTWYTHPTLHLSSFLSSTLSTSSALGPMVSCLLSGTLYHWMSLFSLSVTLPISPSLSGPSIDFFKR